MPDEKTDRLWLARRKAEFDQMLEDYIQALGRVPNQRLAKLLVDMQKAGETGRLFDFFQKQQDVNLAVVADSAIVAVHLATLTMAERQMAREGEPHTGD